MHLELRSKIDSLRKRATPCTDIKSIYDSAMAELNGYSCMITDFFSYKGDAQEIKKLYQRLKTLDYTRNRVIPCINVDKAVLLYNEYFDGMVTFLDKFIHEVINNGMDNTVVMQKQLQTAVHADPLFIDSLFGGKNNEVEEKELTDAVESIESLIDFSNVLNHFKSTLADIYGKIASGQCGNDMPHMNMIKLISDSVCVFSNRMMCTILDTYIGINHSLDDKSVKMFADASFKVF